MWNSYSISVLLPTYAEASSLKKVIEGFEKLNICDEIIVINNNAEHGTTEEVAKTTAKEVFEKVQGYGAAIKKGLSEAEGDLIVICEPDDTFDPADLFKLLPFLDKCDSVYGSRTVNNFIWTGANMGIFLKWGNWFVAKIIEILFNTSYLSDVGCTFRIIKREFIDGIDCEKFANDGRFGMEMLLASSMLKIKSVQVPVNYRARIGKSGYTGDYWGAAKLGTRMIFLILNRRFTKKSSYYAR
jgi:glycosyltransferase involved in cell wall biosynthesis